MILIARKGFDIKFDFEKIGQYLFEAYDKNNQDFFQPKSKLIFSPFWLFEYHHDLATGYGALDAVTSQIKLDRPHMMHMAIEYPEDLDKILTKEKYQLIDEVILEPRITDIKEAEKIISYKVPQIIDKKDIIFSKIDLVYIPYWRFTIPHKGKNFDFAINAYDENKIKIKLDPFIQENIVVKEVKGKQDVFVDSFNDFFNPIKFFGNFFSLIFKGLKWVFNSLIQTFKKSPVLFIFVICVLVLVIILIRYF